MSHQTITKPYQLDPRQGRALWHLGALLVFKALGEETNGQFWAVEGMADRRMKVPLHLHHNEDEYWYVLEGSITFTIGDQKVEAGPGSFAYVPRDVPHTFQVRSDTARWLGMGTPAGFDRWFFETGVPAASLTLPPPAETPPDAEALTRSLLAYGTVVLGPPPE